MNPESQSEQPTSAQLDEAFRLFLQASKEIEAQQSKLQDEVQRLSQDLAGANQRLAALLAALPAGVVLIENGQVRDINPASAAMVPGLSPGKPWEIPESWIATPVKGEYQTGTDSSSRTVQLKEVDIGEQTILQIQDITESLAEHAANQRQSKLASMGQMAASIAHQFRTPLATATLYAGHLADASLASDRKLEMLERLRKQLSSLEQLTTRMLQFVRQRPQKTAAVPVIDLVNDAAQAIRPMCERCDVALHVTTTGEEAVAIVDRDAIVSALVAVLENALQVSSKQSAIHFNAHVQDSRVTMHIDDQGPGIAKELLGTLFDPFITSRANGTGLGLAIARNAVEAHRGEIVAANRTGGGARFTLTLPCMPSL